jgi:hypothetical protein
MKIRANSTGRSLVRQGLIQKRYIKTSADGVSGKQGKLRRYAGHICIEEMIIMEIHVEGSTWESLREIMGVAINMALVVHQL